MDPTLDNPIDLTMGSGGGTGGLLDYFSGASSNPFNQGGNGAGGISGLLSGIVGPDGSVDKAKLKTMMSDPSFIAALQLMTSKGQPDMMKIASQAYSTKPGGLGGLGGM